VTLASVLPVLVVVALHARFGPSLPLSASLAVLTLLPVVFRPRVVLGGAVQVVLGVLAFGIVLALSLTFFPRPMAGSEALPTPWASLATALLSVVVLRGWLARPAGGEPAHLALATFALMACGGTLSGRIYPSGVAVFLVAALVARRRASPSSTPLVVLARRHAISLVVLGFVTAATATGISRALPDAHAWAMQKILGARPPAVGVGGRLWLGSMRGLLDSSQPVLRVRGEVELLRGIAFNRYDLGRWSRDESRIETLSTPPSLEGASAVELEWLDGDPRRYFSTLDAEVIAFSSGVGRIDPLGNLDTVEAYPATRTFLRRGAGGFAAVAPPAEEDLRIPPNIARQLTELARRWTEGLAEDRAKLEALEEHLLVEYRYSLKFERAPYGDPVIEFLFSSSEGHCEYFASAHALLARTLGIPARVVVGYRAVERNPVTGHLVVRERDAHAWVEAWDGRWVTFDPTPAGDGALLAEREMPLMLALFDALGAAGGRFLVWLDGLTVAQAVAAALLLVLLGAALRWHRTRSRRSAQLARDAFEPLPEFVAVRDALTQAGLDGRPDETIERLVRRVAGSGLPSELVADCVGELVRYAALRYGDVGDPRAVRAALEALATRLRTRH